LIRICEHYTGVFCTVRGVGFVTGFGLHPSLRGTVSDQMHHVTDWLPTLLSIAVRGVAPGAPTTKDWKSLLEPSEPPRQLGDGVDNSLLFTAAAPSKRTEMILEAHPPGLEHEGHGSALRVGKKRTAVLTQRTAVLRWVGSADSICQDRLRTATNCIGDSLQSIFGSGNCRQVQAVTECRRRRLDHRRADGARCENTAICMVLCTMKNDDLPRLGTRHLRKRSSKNGVHSAGAREYNVQCTYPPPIPPNGSVLLFDISKDPCGTT
jgi:hypothetical protein